MNAQRLPVNRIWLFLVPLLQLITASVFVLLLNVDPVVGIGIPVVMTGLFFWNVLRRSRR